MEVDDTIFQDPQCFRKGKFLKMVMENFLILLGKFYSILK